MVGDKGLGPVRTLEVGVKSYGFVHVPLDFSDHPVEDVFSGRNNKTLRETISHHRYRALAQVCEARYEQHLDSPLGEVLCRLKASGDAFYKRFLNAYGDLAYSAFSIAARRRLPRAASTPTTLATI